MADARSVEEAAAAAAIGAGLAVAEAVAPAAGPAGVAAVGIVDAVLEAIALVLQEHELAKAQGEVLRGAELVTRSAARVAAAATDPGLPKEVLPVAAELAAAPPVAVLVQPLPAAALPGAEPA